MKLKTFALLATFAFASPCLHAQNVNFLTDYSKLTDGSGTGFTKVYIAPGAFDKVGSLTSLMVDQPEIFIDPDSKYKGVKPADAMAVAEMLRAALISGIGNSIDVVDEPGDSTGLINWAVTNIRVNKKKRGLLGYTPVGAVAYGVKTQMTDIVDKTQAFDVVFELEGSDIETGDVYFAMVFDFKAEGVKAVWQNALELAEGLGERVGCRVKNASLADNNRQDCMAIPLDN